MTIRGERRKGEVLITVGGAPLDWRSSLAVRNHSPTGPAWGYGGSGPVQLALAILLAVTDEATAERFYQKFKWEVLAPLEADRWALDTGDVPRLVGVGGGDGRCRAPGGGDVSSRRRRVRTAGPTCSPGRTSRVRTRRAGRRSTRCGSRRTKP